MGIRIFGFLIFLFVASAALASEGRAMLEDFFNDLNTLRADFEQVVTDANGNVQEQAGGRVYLSLPDQFRWDYEQPYEQLILADGDKVWVYDVLLEQITVRDQQGAAARSPMMALANIRLLDEHFQVQELGEKGDYYWLRMYPREGEGNFEYMDVAVDQGGLKRMVFTDRFGQETEIRFSNLETNVRLEKELFDFTPPAGTDVIGLEPRERR